MSQKKRNTTGLPGSTRREAYVRKSYRSRAQREQETNRLVVMISALLAAVIIVILAGAFLIDTVIKPSQAVASVGGANISTADFQKRVIFERWLAGNQLSQIYKIYGDQAFGQGSPYAQTYDNLLQPSLFGKQILDQMTDYLTIKQYADEHGIKVDDTEIQNQVGKQFGYNPNPATGTPTLTPSMTLTPLVSSTPSPTPTITPSPSMTTTPTVTPFPTGIPTVTPGPTEQKTQFDKTQKDVYAAAAKLTGLSETDMRQLFTQKATETALATMVREAVAGKLEPIQEEVKVRHILLKTEAEANDVIKALQAGESFSDLARAVSTDSGSAANGGELGWTPHGKYVPEFEAYVWSGKVGDISTPINTLNNGPNYGFHVVQIEAREKRQLTDQEQQDVQNKAFSDWLKKAKADKKAQTYDNVWPDRVPETPSLDQFGIPTNLSTGGLSGSGFPTQ